MSFARRAVVLSVIGALLGATAAAIITGDEVWPICNYPMFAKLSRRTPPATRPVLRVVHRDGSEHGYPQERPVLYREFDGFSAYRVVDRLFRQGGFEREKAERFLAILLEGLRRASPEESPRALRLYVVTREPAGEGSTSPAPSRRLLLEVTESRPF